MGHSLAEKLSPAAENPRLTQLRELLTAQFETTLSEGVVLTSQGLQIVSPLHDVIDHLPEHIRLELEAKQALNVPFRLVSGAINEVASVSRQHRLRVYVIAPGTDAKLGYELEKGGAITPVIVGADGTKTKGDIFHNGVFSGFVRTTENVFHAESLPGSFKRFTTEILRGIADTNGLGRLPSRTELFVQRYKTPNTPQAV